jgi:hypothetical protein
VSAGRLIGPHFAEGPLVERGPLSIAVAALACALSGCGGVVGSLPAEEAVYSFNASVAVTPDKPVEGLRVNLSVEVTSDCSSPVLADVLLKVVSDADEVLYEQRWDEVNFKPADVWNLNQGFNPTVVNAASYKVQLQVRRHDTGELLFDQPELGRLTFQGT